MAQQIVKRIFGARKMPEGLSDKELDEYFHKNFPIWTTEFEESGYLDQTKVRAIADEDELHRRLRDHKDELVVVKYWKRGCIPCLALADMFKKAEEQARAEGRKMAFYSINIRTPEAVEVTENQLVDGTPTFQTFYQYKQVGDEIRETDPKRFMSELIARAPH